MRSRIGFDNDNDSAIWRNKPNMFGYKYFKEFIVALGDFPGVKAGAFCANRGLQLVLRGTPELSNSRVGLASTRDCDAESPPWCRGIGI